MDDPCECGVQDPERESNKQPASAPLLQIGAEESFGASSRRAVAKRKPFSGGGGLGGTVVGAWGGAGGAPGRTILKHAGVCSASTGGAGSAE